MNQKIYTNSTVRIEAQIRLRTGDLVDPIGVRFFMTDPEGILTQYTWGTNIELKHDNGATGIFYVEWFADKTGKYKYTWESYGDIAISQKGIFEAENSRW